MEENKIKLGLFYNRKKQSTNKIKKNLYFRVEG